MIEKNEQNYFGSSMQSQMDTSYEVHVETEFGELKEVIVGSPLAEEDRIFSWIPGMDEEFSWLKPRTFDFIKGHSGELWKDACPKLFAKINAQLENYATKLQQLGVIVHRVPRLEEKDRTYINIGVEQVWPRDPWCTAGNTVIASALRMPWKRKQYLAGNKLYVPMMEHKKCRYIQVPQPSTEILSPIERQYAAERYSILLDGGDFIVNENEIYLGQGHGSNQLGAIFCQTILGSQFKVYPIKLHHRALHLDCAISLVRPGLGLICRSWILSPLPPALEKYHWIDVTESEAASLGVNGLAVNPDLYMIDSQHYRLIEELQKHKVDVVDIPFDGPAFLGGALRCSSQPIYRSKV